MDDLLTATETAAKLRISEKQFRRLHKAGKLEFPVLTIGNRLRIPAGPFYRYLGVEEEAS